VDALASARSFEELRPLSRGIRWMQQLTEELKTESVEPLGADLRAKIFK
jgi:hypothetical protein